MIRRIAYILPLVFAALLALAWFTPSHSPSERMVVTFPSASPSLPECATEDGSGQALCWWDAQTQGNGMGASLVSGDCAPDYIGGKAASDLCVALFDKGQDGIDAVGECIEIENTISDIDRKNEGWNITECFKAFE